jgi:hypothetical protein
MQDSIGAISRQDNRNFGKKVNGDGGSNMRVLFDSVGGSAFSFFYLLRNAGMSSVQEKKECYE